MGGGGDQGPSPRSGVNETRLQRAVSSGAQNTGTALPSPRWLPVSALQKPSSLLSAGGG